MNIFGIGVDIVNIKRITKIIKQNTAFKRRVFTKSEVISCEKKKANAFSCFAKKFAAKEAFSKCLGIGISEGLTFNEIEIRNDKRGKPILKVLGKSLKVVNKIIKKKKFNTFLSLSDDKPFAIAIIILTTK